MRKGSQSTDFTRIIIYTPVKKTILSTQFYPIISCKFISTFTFYALFSMLYPSTLEFM